MSLNRRALTVGSSDQAVSATSSKL